MELQGLPQDATRRALFFKQISTALQNFMIVLKTTISSTAHSGLGGTGKIAHERLPTWHILLMFNWPLRSRAHCLCVEDFIPSIVVRLPFDRFVAEALSF